MLRHFYLQAGNSGWQHKTHVVSVDHSEYADGPSGDSPGVLVRQLFLAGPLRVLKHNLEHLGEVLAQMMGCGTLSREKNENSATQYWPPSTQRTLLWCNTWMARPLAEINASTVVV